MRMMVVEGYVQREVPYESDYSKSIESENPSDMLNDPEGIMRKLNDANWAYSIEYSKSVVKYYLNDLDNLRISMRLRRNEHTRKDEQDMLIYLPLSELTLDLSTNTAYFDKY